MLLKAKDKDYNKTLLPSVTVHCTKDSRLVFRGAKYTHAFTPVIKQQQRYVTTTTTITKIRVNIGKLFRKKYMMYK